MSWYYGTFSCGHEGRVNIIGKSKDRQWKADRKFSGLCEDCFKEQLEKEKQEANKEALKAAKEMNLIELVGTEKQVAWANTLRNKRIEEISDLRERIINKDSIAIKYTFKNLAISKEGCNTEDEIINKIHMYLDKAEEYILANEKASYWIDNRMNELYDIFEKIASKININELEVAIEEEIISETTVAPDNPKHNGIVEFIVTENKINLKYEKNETFISVVKDLGYRWNNGYWTRTLKETTGNYIDRAAEIGNKLLNEGFSISIQDEDIRNKAINGYFEKECTRWIYRRLGETKLAITWKGMNDTLYKVSKKLPGARWQQSSMLVDVAHYSLVEEFAEMYGFQFTKLAVELIERYKEDIKKVRRVNPIKVKEKAYKNGLEDILNSSREVITDLMEE